MDYFVTAWKDGKHIKTISSVDDLRDAKKTANKMISGKMGFSCDCVDICVYGDSDKLKEKHLYTKLNGVWHYDLLEVNEE